MKLVEFTRDMRPQAAGSTRVVPDDVAARLEAEGAVRNVRPWPEPPPEAAGAASTGKPAAPPAKRGGKQSYQVK